jgi:uncharacterized protein YeaO (DUF488 family)
MSGDSKITPSAIRLKRAYESPEAEDGIRVLVDRLWARGVAKRQAKLDAWMKELGPSDELRMWFSHRPDRWDPFSSKYMHELATPLRQMLLAELQGVARGSTVTLVYGAHDSKENEAVVLRDYLLKEQARPDVEWDAMAKVLVTAGVVAAADHDAVAPLSGIKLFGSAILTGQEIESAVEGLQASGALRESAGGWQITPLGRKRQALVDQQ